MGQALSYVGVVWWLLFFAAAILVLAVNWTLDGDRMVRSAMPDLKESFLGRKRTGLRNGAGPFFYWA